MPTYTCNLRLKTYETACVSDAQAVFLYIILSLFVCATTIFYKFIYVGIVPIGLQDIIWVAI